MSALVLDTGAFVAVDRGLELRSTGVVVAEVWRDERGRQAHLARLLKAVDVRAVDERLGREAGVLLGKAGVTDATDATVVAVAATGDCVLTSDPVDLGKLVAASHRSILVLPC